MERAIIKGEEVISCTVEEFIRATRPDGKGYIFLDGEKIAAFDEVICDWCNADIKQPDDNPGKAVVHVVGADAWCEECFRRWQNDQGEGVW